MNKTKRGFELAGSIIVIIIASFLIIGCLYCLVSWDIAKSLMEDIYGCTSQEKVDTKPNIYL